MLKIFLSIPIELFDQYVQRHSYSNRLLVLGYYVEDFSINSN